MAALVQSFPQHSSTVTMLQTRPSSSTGFQTTGQNQQQARNAQMSRTIYNTVGNVGSGSYRGHPTMAPVAPYAFTATPGTTSGGNPLRQNPTPPHLRPENRTSSAPVVPYSQNSTVNNAPSSAQKRLSMPLLDSSLPADDSVAFSSRTLQALARPVSSIDLAPNASDLKVPSLPASSKRSPDRYRRVQTASPVNNAQATSGSSTPSGSGLGAVGNLYSHAGHSASSPSLMTQNSSYRGMQQSSQVDSSIPHSSQVSKDDMSLQRPSSSEQAKRYRRRSISSLDAKEYNSPVPETREQKQPPPPQRTYASVLSGTSVSEPQVIRRSPVPQKSETQHGRNGSASSSVSSRSNSRPSSAKREVAPSTASTTPIQSTPVAKHEAKLVNIPPRGTSDANKRLTNPSPLSKPITMGPSPAPSQNVPTLQPSPMESSTSTAPTVSIPESPAAQQLAALNKKENKKDGKSSRLRRAFSFGSAAELRKASAENSHNNNVTTERAKLRKDRYQDEREAEQAAIVQKQEAGGLGEGIYSGQGQFFTGSTDNLSISSTASSASVMIRKMGKGMKKSTRSLVGLFRPKSVVGVPPADSAVPEPSVAQVSMVTVEAEREKVNVNANPHDQAGGGTGFPHLERNSMDTASATTEPSLSLTDRSIDDARVRRSIVGGERERAEVLAAVKKGILKRGGIESGNSSPITKPADLRTSEYTLPQLPNFRDETPNSSSPSTPTDDQPRGSHKRTDSVTIEGEDYFMSVANFGKSDAKSMPGTPRSLAAARNISFSPRIQFHDTWPSGEYDRRGEIATCNRLTPMLAQQIKEELNSFKMEMEVHEQSKVYTHFF